MAKLCKKKKRTCLILLISKCESCAFMDQLHVSGKRIACSLICTWFARSQEVFRLCKNVNFVQFGLTPRWQNPRMTIVCTRSGQCLVICVWITVRKRINVDICTSLYVFCDHLACNSLWNKLTRAETCLNLILKFFYRFYALVMEIITMLAMHAIQQYCRSALSTRLAVYLNSSMT